MHGFDMGREWIYGKNMRFKRWCFLLLITVSGCICERVVERILSPPSPPRLDPLPQITNSPVLSVISGMILIS